MSVHKNSGLINFLLGLLIVAALAAVVFTIQSQFFRIQDRFGRVEQIPLATTSSSTMTAEEDDARPPFTDDIEAQLNASQGFQHLVSYTDRGFEPPDLEVKVGETVRFTNNSDRELRLVAVDGVERSSGATDCTSSEDCKIIAKKRFWEITYNEPVSQAYANGNERGGAGIVVITAQ